MSIDGGPVRPIHERAAQSRPADPPEGIINTTVHTTDTATWSIGTVAKRGIPAVLAACAATMAVAAAGNAAGISLEVSSAPIPVAGFGVLTAVFSVIGLLLAVVLSRVARHPRQAFIRTTVVLTVLSFVPDAIADAGASTKALLMLTHLVAAAIVIPLVARRLPTR